MTSAIRILAIGEIAFDVYLRSIGAVGDQTTGLDDRNDLYFVDLPTTRGIIPLQIERVYGVVDSQVILDHLDGVMILFSSEATVSFMVEQIKGLCEQYPSIPTLICLSAGHPCRAGCGVMTEHEQDVINDVSFCIVYGNGHDVTRPIITLLRMVHGDGTISIV